MNLARQQAARHRAIIGAICAGGGSIMTAALMLAPWLTLGAMAGGALAIVQAWRMVARVRPPGGER